MKEQSNEKEEVTESSPQETPDQEHFVRLNTKLLPVIIMLAAGGTTSIITYINQYSLKNSLIILLIILVVFYILGLLIKRLFDSFKIAVPKEETISEEGEVIKKEPEHDAEDSVDKVETK